jgi:hypothetical protein
MLLVSLYFRWDKKYVLEFGLFYGVLAGFAGEGDHFGGRWELKVKKILLTDRQRSKDSTHGPQPQSIFKSQRFVATKLLQFNTFTILFNTIVSSGI